MVVDVVSTDSGPRLVITGDCVLRSLAEHWDALGQSVVDASEPLLLDLTGVGSCDVSFLQSLVVLSQGVMEDKGHLMVLELAPDNPVSLLASELGIVLSHHLTFVEESVHGPIQ